MGRATSLDPGRRQPEGAGESRECGRLEDEPCPGGSGHLEAMPQEPEARDIGRRNDPVCDKHLRGGPVERAHLIDRNGKVVGRRHALPSPRHYEPGPEPLGEQQDIAGARAALSQQPARMRGADDRQSVLGFSVPDGVAARKDAACLAHLGRGTIEDRCHDLDRQILRECRDG